MTGECTCSVSILVHERALNEFSGLCCPSIQGDAETLRREALNRSNHWGLVCLDVLSIVIIQERKEADGT